MSPNGTPKTVLITGGSSGIGYGVAEAFLERGDNVILNGRNESRLRAAAEKLGAPERIAIVAGDIGSSGTGQRMVDTARERFGRVDVLVNSAGTFDAKPLGDYEESEIDGFLREVRGTYLAIQAAAEAMRGNGGGSIINITTILTLRGDSRIPSSAPIAAKGGLQALTKNLAVELAPDNIRVNTVAPGIIKTPIHGLEDDQFESLSGMQPLGRVGEVRHIVDAVLYFADADFTTGATLPVDGGAAAGA